MDGQHLAALCQAQAQLTELRLRQYQRERDRIDIELQILALDHVASSGLGPSADRLLHDQRILAHHIYALQTLQSTRQQLFVQAESELAHWQALLDHGSETCTLDGADGLSIRQQDALHDPDLDPTHSDLSGPPTDPKPGHVTCSDTASPPIPRVGKGGVTRARPSSVRLSVAVSADNDPLSMPTAASQQHSDESANGGEERDGGGTEPSGGEGPGRQLRQRMSGSRLIAQRNTDTVRVVHYFARRVYISEVAKLGTGINAYAVYMCVAEREHDQVVSSKRYSDFVAFRTHILREYPELKNDVPALPPKTMLGIGKFSSKTMAQREAAFTRFLQAVSALPECQGLLAEWFGVSELSDTSITGNTSRGSSMPSLHSQTQPPGQASAMAYYLEGS